MSFVDKFYEFVDFTERVVVFQNRDGETSTFEIERAALFSRRFVDSDADSPPRLVGVWRLPLDEKTRSIRRGDKIRDADSQIWIASETTPSRPLQVLSCQCFCEQLFPESTDAIDVLRPLRSGGFATVAAQVPALVKRRETASSQEAAFPASTFAEKIEFWIRTETLVRPSDVVVANNGTRYEATSYSKSNDVSDWGVLAARRLVGVDDGWRFPKQS